MEYYLTEMPPMRFQRLVNTILLNRFGEDARLTPLRGADGGRDGETAPGNPFVEYLVVPAGHTPTHIFSPPRAGRHLFQVKHHSTIDISITETRRRVVADFRNELTCNVLPRVGPERVNYFFLITNVPASKEAQTAIDDLRTELLAGVENLHADVWWKEQLTAYLDQMPQVWSAFPEIFAGGQPPVMAAVAARSAQAMPRALRLAIDRQYARDREVKFRQVELKREISRLFVDLELTLDNLTEVHQQEMRRADLVTRKILFTPVELKSQVAERHVNNSVSALGALLDETSTAARRMVIEGGPGHGKSTVTQMVTQIYRGHLLQAVPMEPERRWLPPSKARLPFRIELRQFGEWLANRPTGSVDEYLAEICQADAGGAALSVEDVQRSIENAPVLLVFDGLDEVGSDDLRDLVIEKVVEATERFESGLGADVRVVITTRPPAIAGRRDRLSGFEYLPIISLTNERIDEYVRRWVSVQVPDDEEEERRRITQSFQRRRRESHVAALAKNPMQLSVLLHFIRLKGEAFPDRRADLYGDYFQIVIDRDVEKSPELSEQRDVVEALHQFIGYTIHSLTEAEQADGSLARPHLLRLVRNWLSGQGDLDCNPEEIFKLGEERLGLLVVLRGEGEDAHYGFQVQPIREYFAAAFLNYQIVGNAHEVFQAAIRRPYWREVALFLAGLRRPNEKADLIVRARELDLDPDLAWRQDGRLIIASLSERQVRSLRL